MGARTSVQQATINVPNYNIDIERALRVWKVTIYKDDIFFLKVGHVPPSYLHFITLVL
jgi:hypothetical protein